MWYAVVAQLGDVALHGGLGPHLLVHRRRDEHRAGERQQQRAQQIVGDAVGGLGQEVGRRGRDAQQLRLPGQLDVRPQRMVVRLERLASPRGGR